MRDITKKIVFSVILVSLFSHVQSEEIIKKIKILKKFPTEEQMDKHDFVLGKGTRFTLTKDSIFFCSQFEHKILKFDLDGNFLLKFGKPGQGPGDFNKPKKVFVYKDELFISDNGNNRMMIHSLDGKFKNQIRIINTMSDFVVVDDKIFILMPNRAGAKERENTPIFGIFNLKGELINKIKGSFYSQYNDFILDNKVRLRVYDNCIHCLQEYGTTYRIYSINGDLINEFELGKNPLNDKEYKKLKYLYTYQTFCVQDNKIYTSCVARGKIVLYVFDMKGRYIFKYENKMEQKDSLYDVTDMMIIKRKGKVILYLLFFSPEIEFMIAKL